MDFTAFAAFDSAVASVLRAVASPPVTRAFWAATLAGDTPVMTAFTVAAVVLLWAAGRRRPAVVLAVFMAVDPVLAEGLKAAFARPRPPLSAAMIGMPGDAAFPSGHALASMLCYGLLALVAVSGGASTRRKVLAVAGAVAGALMVGASRVYLGVHWASDVIGSWMVGVPLLALAGSTLWLWSRRRGPEDPPQLAPGQRRRLLWSAVACAVAVVAVMVWQAGVDPLL